MRRVLAAAGVALFVVILATTGPAKIAGAFRGAEPAPFAEALAFSAAMAIAKSWRWRLLLDAAGLPTPFVATLRRFLVGNFLGLATPGRVGDLAKSLYFAGRGEHAVARATASIAVDRLLDIVVLALLGSAILLEERGWLAALPLVAAAIFAALFAAKRRAGERLLRRAFGALAPGERGDRASSEFAAFYAQVAALVTRRRLALPLAAAMLAYLFLVVGVERIAAGLGLDLPIGFVASSVILSIFASLLPISVAGLGSRDAVLIACFAQRGLPAETAVSVSLALLAIFYVAPAAAGAVLWQITPVAIPGRTPRADAPGR
jgi:uncharacterized protein (TIRG00374 family)